MAIKKKTAPAKSTAKAKTVAKAAPKAVKKPVSKVTSKAAVKPVAKKTALVKKIAAKPVVKQAVKPVAKKAAPAPVKAQVKAQPKIVEKAVKAAPVAKTPVKAKEIVVKAPTNQNAEVKKSPVVMQKTTEGYKPVSTTSSSLMMRPAYRPIQVTNKSLAPMTPVRQMAPAPANEKIEYKKGDYVVYPAHGVGQIEAIETAVISGMEIKLYAIVFEKDRMRLKVPVFKAHASGLRRLSTTNRMQDALKTLQGRAQIRRAMWSRRAQEYETKINSGDPVSIAEVLRDLKRSNDESEQSYSERQIYQSAMERLAREVAAVDRITEIEATERLEKLIRGGRKSKAEEKAIEDKAIEAKAIEDKAAQAA